MDKIFFSAFMCVVLVGATGQVLAEARVAFLCEPHPCQVDKFHETGIKLTAGVINKGDSASGDLRVVVSTGKDGIEYYTQGFAYYSDALAPGAQYDSGTELITGFKMPESYQLNDSGETFFGLFLYEKVSGVWTYRDRVNLKPAAFIPARLGGESSGMQIYLDGRDGNPSIEDVGGGEVVVRIPRIVNTSPDPVTINRLVLGHSDSEEYWGRSYQVGLDEQNLSITIDAFSTLTNVEVRGAYNQPNYPYTHLSLRSDRGTEVWQTLEARQGNSITTYPYFAESTDWLTDSDGDGVSDANENLVGTDPGNAQSQPETVVIDVMGLYTPDVASFYNGEPIAGIVQYVEWANQALANSGVDARYRLVGTKSVDWVKSLLLDDTLDAMREQRDGFEGLDALRESVGADLVMTFVWNDSADGTEGTGGKCGLAYKPGAGMEGDVSDIRRDLLVASMVAGCGSRTFAHELGHNLGLGHDAREAKSPYGTFDWSRGHGSDDNFVTVMAYGSGYNNPGQAQYFSNPEKDCPGGPCGVDRSDPELGADASRSIWTTMYQASQLSATAVDSDADGTFDGLDNCPDLQNGDQLDTDGDGQGNACDDDDDGDGVRDGNDAFPQDPNETKDTDGDGTGDNADQDADGDGVIDVDAGGITGGNVSADFASNYAVSLSVHAGCAFDDDGLQCWGGRGWVGGRQIPPLSNPTQVTAGDFHACALDDTGAVCWGYNDDGRADVPALSNPHFVAAKSATTCALDDTGVVCWGSNGSGEADAPALRFPREVSIGAGFACALDDNGVACWGDTSKINPSAARDLVNPENLTVGDWHACVMDNGRVVCWGTYFSPSNGNSPVHEQPSLVNPREVVAGGYHACALDDYGVKCWGRAAEGQLEIPTLNNPSRLYAAGRFGTCALDDNGLQCWGSEESEVISEKEPSLAELPGDLSFASAGQRVVTQYLQTTSTSKNITTLNVLNSSGRSQTFRGILRSGSGEKVGADEPVLGSDIPPMGRLTLNSSDLEEIFGVEPWRGPAMLTVRGDSTFDLMSKLESPSGLVSNTNCVRDNRVLNLEGFDSNNMSYVRLINTGAKTTRAIRGTLYDGNGNVVGNANAVLISKLDPYQQTWINRDKLSDLIGSQWDGEGMLEVKAAPGLKLLNLNFITDESTFFNFSCADKATLLADSSEYNDPANIGRIYLQTTSTSKNVSLTHLVNISGSPQEYTGTLYASDGTQVGLANQSLHSGTVPPKGRLILSSADIESAFDIPPWSGPAILEVKGDGLFELMTKLESPSGLISNTNCVRNDQVHNIGGFDQADVTYVRFINAGNTPIVNIRGSLYDDAGSVVGESNPVLVDELPANSHVWRNRKQLSELIGTRWNGTASLKIDNADSNLRLLNLNFINGETFFNFSCYEAGR